jgi:hypothetical protein
MFDLTLPSALALVASVSIVVQQVLNANLCGELNSAVWSSMSAAVMRAPRVGTQGRLHWVEQKRKKGTKMLLFEDQ